MSIFIYLFVGVLVALILALIKSIKSIGMHFGTFVLTTEPIDDPPKKLNKILENDKSLIDNFIIPKHGVIYDL